MYRIILLISSFLFTNSFLCPEGGGANKMFEEKDLWIFRDFSWLQPAVPGNEITICTYFFYCLSQLSFYGFRYNNFIQRKMYRDNSPLICIYPTSQSGGFCAPQEKTKKTCSLSLSFNLSYSSICLFSIHSVNLSVCLLTVRPYLLLMCNSYF